MVDNTNNTTANVNETVTNFANSVRDTNQAIIRSAVEAQERNIRFAQSVFENGIEVLKSQADSTRRLIQSVDEHPQDQQTVFQEVVNNTVSAQERNIRFAQSVFENGVEVLKSHADSSRTLMNTVIEQAKEQQDALWSQPYVETYLNVLNAPFTFYRQALETAQAITGQAMDVAQKAARQGLETAQTTAQQGFNATHSATNKGFDVAQQGVNTVQSATNKSVDAAQKSARKNQ